MKRAAAPKRASQTDSSRRTEPAAGLRGIALAPPDYGADLVDRLSASDGPIEFDSSRLNSGRRVRQQKTLFDDISNSPRVVQQTALMDQVANSPRVLQQKAFSDSVQQPPRDGAAPARELTGIARPTRGG